VAQNVAVIADTFKSLEKIEDWTDRDKQQVEQEIQSIIGTKEKCLKEQKENKLVQGVQFLFFPIVCYFLSIFLFSPIFCYFLDEISYFSYFSYFLLVKPKCVTKLKMESYFLYAFRKRFGAKLASE